MNSNSRRNSITLKVLCCTVIWLYISHCVESYKVRRSPQVVTGSSLVSKQQKSGKDNEKCPPNKYVEHFLLPAGYSKYELPTSRNENCKFEKVPIAVGIRIRNIRGIMDLDEEFSMELDLITSWKDYLVSDDLVNKTEDEFNRERGTKYVALESSFLDEIWQPDIVFSKAISITKPAVHTTRINHKPSKLRIYPEGWVELYSRLLVKLYCPMDFVYFPADTQTCVVRLRSYTFSNADVELGWNYVKKGDGTGEIPLIFLYSRSHPNYEIRLHDVKTLYQNELDVSNIPENYTYLQFELSAKRKLTFHLTQTFIPAGFLIVITWLTFFIPLSNLEARIGVAMTTLLTMTNKFSEVGTYTPNVSYINAIDIYMMTCITIVFLTLFQFTFLYWIRMGRTEYAESRISLKRKIPSKGRDQFELEEVPVDHRFFWHVRNFVEVYGFLFTIIGFTLFNIIYWPWLLISSKYFDDEVDLNYNSP